MVLATQNICSSKHLQLKTCAIQNICNSKHLQLKTFATRGRIGVAIEVDCDRLGQTGIAIDWGRTGIAIEWNCNLFGPKQRKQNFGPECDYICIYQGFIPIYIDLTWAQAERTKATQNWIERKMEVNFNRSAILYRFWVLYLQISILLVPKQNT